ncbi:amino acid ABC transporter substrate-binding protein [Georgenia yuyongxinii]|uniref:Amino acid ABC transporter substrate-binding protein n=1 Tax=Georgenia yuyongxinii TaxID=2589797 RepID=A0A5B8C7S1_9MICO|nr:substrate-binding domain-containing protein [Georgenia yuyongxinii]QDC26137.1 amino acid ABC transporter substrate-binding protein [Georgenia yuyongxinii]
MRATRKSLALTLGVATMLAVAACAPSTGGGGNESTSGSSESTTEAAEGGGEPINIGIITSTTGPLAAYGETFVDGFEAGLDYATDGTGEVNGSPLEVKFEDDGGDTDRAVTLARDLIGQGYTILGGTASSGIALSLAEQAEQNKVLYVSGPAASDAITGINDYTFRSGRQSLQDVATAGSFVDVEGQQVLVLAQDNAFGQGNFAAVQAVLGAKGAEVTSVMVPEDVTEFTPFAAQVRDAAPTMVFVAWAGATSGAMWQALDQQGVLDDITVVTGLGDASTFGAYGAASDKIDFLNHYFPGAPDNEINAAMVEHVEAAGGTPDLFTPDGFTAAQMIVRAIEEAGGADDVDAMIAALEGWSFDGPKGSYTIRASDHALIQPMFQVKLVSDGNGGWTPELVSEAAAEDVAPPEAG